MTVSCMVWARMLASAVLQSLCAPPGAMQTRSIYIVWKRATRHASPPYSTLDPQVVMRGRVMHSAELQRREDPITVFMGVPTMYAYLLSAYEAMDEAQQAPARVAARRLRLAVCGSAPCPAPVYQAWERLTGAVSGVQGSRDCVWESARLEVEGERASAACFVSHKMPAGAVRI